MALDDVNRNEYGLPILPPLVEDASEAIKPAPTKTTRKIINREPVTVKIILTNGIYSESCELRAFERATGVGNETELTFSRTVANVNAIRDLLWAIFDAHRVKETYEYLMLWFYKLGNYEAFAPKDLDKANWFEYLLADFHYAGFHFEGGK